MTNEVTWAIQTNLMNELSMRKVWQAAIDSGAKVQEIVVLPFSDDFANADEIPELTGIVIPYGSTSFTKISKRLGWKGNCYVDETFRATAWNVNRSDMLNQDMHVMKVKETPEFFKDIPDDDYWFIRPVRDLKEFAGTVAKVAEIKTWMGSTASGNFSFDEDTEIVVAPEKHLYSESRFFIVGGKVVDGSYYRMGGKLRTQRITESLLLDIAQKMADVWLPHECCVMDIADTDEGLKCIEFNTINGSGFYDHDINTIVKAMTEWAFNLPPEGK